MPPAVLTASDLSVRPTTPRSQTTILPVTFAGSSEPIAQRRASSDAAVAAAASVELIRTPVAGAAADDAPLYTTPSTLTVPWPSRLWVPAAVVMIHGLGCATVAAVGPLLRPRR